MTKPYAVVFAGIPGSSKTIIAHYLSTKFSLPIFSNDVLRYEVKEDMLASELVLPEDLIKKGINVPEVLAEFEKRLTARMNEILSTRKPLIIDGSVDRRWPARKEQLLKNGYDWFLISLELSKPFLENLFKSTGREFFIPQLDGYLSQHESFINKYGDEVNLFIRDQDFSNRLKLAASGLQNYVAALEENSAIG